MESENRLIDANLLSECLLELEVAGGHWLYRKACDEMILGFFPKIINEQPTVDAVEVVHGRWLTTYKVDTWMGTSEIDGYVCSECGRGSKVKGNYCPNCGAKMDGDGNG